MKVTTKNYFDTIERVGLNNLPPDLKEMHEYVLDTFKTGESKKGNGWFYYNDDNSIRGLIDDYFTMLSEEYAKDVEENSDQTSKRAKSGKSKSSDSEEEYEDAEPLYQDGSTVYEKSTGKKLHVRSSKLTVDQSSHDYSFVYELTNEAGHFYRAGVKEKELTDVQPPKHVTPDDIIIPDPSKSKYKKGETVYLISDGTELIVDGVMVPLVTRKHKYLYNLMSSQGKYYQNIPEEELTEIRPEKTKEKPAIESKSKSSVSPDQHSRSRTKKAGAPGGKNPPPEEKEFKSTGVEMISPDIAFIREWASMNGKVKPINKLAGFVKRMQIAIVEKRIRKDAPFADEFMAVQREAIKLHKKSESSRNKEVLVEIPAPRFAVLAEIGGLQHLLPTVQFIKAYMRMMGKPVEREKVLNLHKRIKAAAEKIVFTNKDKYIEQIRHIINSLEVFAKTKKRTGILEIHPAQLNGLQGILEHCGCNELHGIGDEDEDEETDLLTEEDEPVEPVGEDSEKGYDEENDDTPKSMSSEEAATRQYILLNFDHPDFSFLGKPSTRFVMMVYGLEGSGKTTFLLQFAKYLAENFGRVLYVTPEEYDSPTLTMTLNRLNIHVPEERLTFAEHIYDHNPQDYDFIFIDSVNDHDMSYKEFRALRKKYKSKSFIPVFQTTKLKEYRGVGAWKHKADLTCFIENGKITIIKSRYGSLGNTGIVPGMKIAD